MVFVALFFDFLALLACVLLIMLMLYYIGSNFNFEFEARMLNEAAENVSDGGGCIGDQCDTRAAIAVGSAAYKLAKAAATGAGGIGILFLLIPLVYTAVSFISTLLAYFVFTIWFFLKGVNMWSFTNAQRVGINLLSGIIEFLPLVNLLPAITVMVWRHVKISQVEDRIKEADQAKKIQQQLNNLPQGAV
jgi:hypothetical protein